MFAHFHNFFSETSQVFFGRPSRLVFDMEALDTFVEPQSGEQREISDFSPETAELKGVVTDIIAATRQGKEINPLLIAQLTQKSKPRGATKHFKLGTPPKSVEINDNTFESIAFTEGGKAECVRVLNDMYKDFSSEKKESIVSDFYKSTLEDIKAKRAEYIAGTFSKENFIQFIEHKNQYFQDKGAKFTIFSLDSLLKK